MRPERFPEFYNAVRRTTKAIQSQKQKRENINLMCDEKVGRQDRCGSLVAPSVVALAALQIKRGKDGKECQREKSI